MCEECNDKARKKEEEEEEQEPELRSYQRDLYDWLWEKRQEELKLGEQPRLPLLSDPRPESRRMTRDDKKQRGWRVPPPSQGGRGRLAKALHTFLVNLTRPIDQRHQVGAPPAPPAPA